MGKPRPEGTLIAPRQNPADPTPGRSHSWSWSSWSWSWSSVLVLVVLVLVVLVLVLVLVLVPLLLSHIGVAAAASERAPLLSAKAGMLAEHRTDAVEQEPAADHACCC